MQRQRRRPGRHAPARVPVPTRGAGRFPGSLVLAGAAVIGSVLAIGCGSQDPPAPGPEPSVLPRTQLPRGGTVIFSELGVGDLASRWGAIDCEATERIVSESDGGDPQPTAARRPQPTGAYRRFRVLDGDDSDGERCELGQNDHREGPTAIYHEGDRRITFISVRLPRGNPSGEPGGYPLASPRFQVILQMKQTQPSANGGGTPVLALEARDGRWRLNQSTSAGPSGDTRELWSAPAELERWTRFALDVTYSRDPDRGRVTVFVDLNGDGDFDDGDERSQTLGSYTLKQETDGGASGDGIDPGESIPSHLRVGIYHDPEIDCPPPGGCEIEIDNLQVVSP